ncbi:hypothetical protein PR048_026175 [Dryococelus australis]|uniref:Uncharacterized protein n=1 Tax=Dryococelus australis TaxID=614101 RepID=A0ABQ9GKL7_9NEOP|nr:hypothetical protein PR048_026175 [Dryococelus australis]
MLLELDSSVVQNVLKEPRVFSGLQQARLLDSALHTRYIIGSDCSSHLDEAGSIPEGVAPGFLRVAVVTDDTAGRWVFSGLSRSSHSGHLTTPRNVVAVSLTRACPSADWSLEVLTFYCTYTAYFKILSIGSTATWKASYRSLIGERRFPTRCWPATPFCWHVRKMSRDLKNSPGAGETRDPRENPPTRGFVRHNFHLRKSGVTRPGIEPGSPRYYFCKYCEILFVLLNFKLRLPNGLFAMLCRVEVATSWLPTLYAFNKMFSGLGRDWTYPTRPINVRRSPYWANEVATAAVQTLRNVCRTSSGQAEADDTVRPPIGIARRCEGARSPRRPAKQCHDQHNEFTFAIGSEFIMHALDDSEPIADLLGNKWQIPYCQVGGNTEAAADGHTSEALVYTGLWSLAYRQDTVQITTVLSSFLDSPIHALAHVNFLRTNHRCPVSELRNPGWLVHVCGLVVRWQFEAEKGRSNKDENATRIKCAIAAKLRALNWRAVLSWHCAYLRDFHWRPYYFVGGKS